MLVCLQGKLTCFYFVSINFLFLNISSLSNKLSIQTEKASRRVGYTSDSMRRSFSSTVVWQSFWYLLSFYLTWPPYLALQYLWAAGGGYSAYGFVLFACTLVPLQGFWNMVVFFRVRAKRKANEALSAIHDKAHQVLESGLKFSHVSGSRLKRQSWLRS